jgi:formylglycine-generating enzyme
MKHSIASYAGLAVLVGITLATAHADTFGSGPNTFTMDFVTIGNAGNVADNTGFGKVDYTYRMGVNEVSEQMINVYNTLSGGPILTKDTRGGNQPATSVSWNEAARFVNWLNTSEGFSVAYQFDTAGGNDNIALWESGDAGYNAANPFRNTNAHYYLPSENEWYKAAYYDPNKSGGAGYWDYATGSDTPPGAAAGGTTSGTAVYGGQTGLADIANAGGLSVYGTMAQNGNVYEWSETTTAVSNSSAGDTRVMRSGAWFSSSGSLIASDRSGTSPSSELSFVGFRVAAVPEPSAFILSLLGMISVVTRRRR